MIRELKNAFQRAEKPDFESMEGLDVHTVGSLLKRYLSELPQPIIPLDSYEQVMKLVTRDMREDADKALSTLCQLLVGLPKHNYNVLRYVCQFLYEVCQFEETNKMTSANLATVFATGIIRPDCEDPALLMGTTTGRTLVTKVFIDKCPHIFKMEYSADGDRLEVDTLLNFDKNSDSSDKNEEVFEKTDSPSLDLLNQELSNSTDLPEPLTAQPMRRQGNLRHKRQTIAPNSFPAVVSPQQSSDNNVSDSGKLGSSSSSEVELEDTEVDDSELDALLSVDLFQLSLEEIHIHMDKVRTKVTDMRHKHKAQIAAMKDKAVEQKAKHRQNMEKMAQNLEKEKNATCDVVSKVVTIQSQLQAYQLKYGFIE